jgi:predicted DNA-binding transcriptional regulator AlpA
MTKNDEYSLNVPDASRLLDISGVARMLQISTRHVYRLADGGRMPRPLKLGGARRWDRLAIEEWIANGCSPTPTPNRGASRNGK